MENDVKSIIRELGSNAAKKNSLTISFDHKTLSGHQGESVTSALGVLLTGTD